MPWARFLRCRCYLWFTTGVCADLSWLQKDRNSVCSDLFRKVMFFNPSLLKIGTEVRESSKSFHFLRVEWNVHISKETHILPNPYPCGCSVGARVSADISDNNMSLESFPQVLITIKHVSGVNESVVKGMAIFCFLAFLLSKRFFMLFYPPCVIRVF